MYRMAEGEDDNDVSTAVQALRGGDTVALFNRQDETFLVVDDSLVGFRRLNVSTSDRNRVKEPSALWVLERLQSAGTTFSSFVILSCRG